MKTVLSAALAVAFVVLAVACAGKQPPKQSSASPDTKPPQPTPSKNVSPVKPTIDDSKPPQPKQNKSAIVTIAEAWNSNPVKAEKDYIGKRITVTGKIFRIDAKDGHSIVGVTVADSVYFCLFLFLNGTDVVNLETGKEVSISGKLDEIHKSDKRTIENKASGFSFMESTIEKPK